MPRVGTVVAHDAVAVRQRNATLELDRPRITLQRRRPVRADDVVAVGRPVDDTGKKSGPVTGRGIAYKLILRRRLVCARLPSRDIDMRCARYPEVRSLVADEVLSIPQGQPFPLERFAEAISVAETPAHGGKPLFVFEDGEDENDRQAATASHWPPASERQPGGCVGGVSRRLRDKERGWESVRLTPTLFCRHPRWSALDLHWLSASAPGRIRTCAHGCGYRAEAKWRNRWPTLGRPST